MRAVNKLIPVVLLCVAIQPTSGQGKDAPAGGALPKVVADVVDCQSLTDQTARLACFDKTVAALASAHRGKEVLIADKQQLRETRKGLFGLNLPAVRLFADAADKDDEDIQEVESVIQSARLVGGKWSFVIADGAQWLQVDNIVLFKEPQPGTSKILIRGGAIGSFLAKVDGQRAIRVKRIVQ